MPTVSVAASKHGYCGGVRLHHTPTYASWLNQVARWFALLTDKKLRRGARRSIQALQKDIRD